MKGVWGVSLLLHVHVHQCATAAAGQKRAFIAVGRTHEVLNSSCQCQYSTNPQDVKREGDGEADGDLGDGDLGKVSGPLLPKRVPGEIRKLLRHWSFRWRLQGWCHPSIVVVVI